jgi:hypothetical protein
MRTRTLFFIAIFAFSGCGGSVSNNSDKGGSPDSSNANKPLALIYKGLGSCSADQGDAGINGYGCSEASADVATAAGFQYQFIGPNDLDNNSTPAQVAAIFQNAKVWIQPGGYANVAAYTMSDRLQTEIVNFVSKGGGYVGFCAGAFMATDTFGIFSGSTALYGYSAIRADLTYTFESVKWNGVNRSIYFEGGPYFYGYDQTAEVIATYNDSGDTAAVRSTYGSGRVFLTGPHVEAPAIWSQENGIQDPDGSDIDLGVQMLKWASGLP